MSRLKIIIPKKELQDLYFNKNLSLNKIADLFNTNEATIHNRFREYGISTRKISEALKGRIPWNRGKKASQETLIKLGKGKKELWKKAEFLEKMKIRDRISSKRMMGNGNPMKNKEISEKVRKKLIGLWSGDKNPMKKIIVRRKVSEILRGHVISLETRDKISKSLTGKLVGDKNPFFGKHHTKENREKSRARAINQLVSGGFKNRRTSIEIILENKLIEKGIDYKSQFPLIGITVVDFYLKKHRIAIYADGEFWHKSRWAKKQGVVEKDKKQNKVLAENGYKVFRFSESEINNSAEKCIGNILNYIDNISA